MYTYDERTELANRVARLIGTISRMREGKLGYPLTQEIEDIISHLEPDLEEHDAKLKASLEKILEEGI